MIKAPSGVQELASGRKAIKSKFVRPLMAGKSSSSPAAIYTALGYSYGALTQCSNLDANLRGPSGGEQAFHVLARRGTHQRFALGHLWYLESIFDHFSHSMSRCGSNG